MRKALSLIELIFTIVIIAIVFTVIPKIVLSLNKADSFTIRQDAIFNGISMMMMISKLPWDENNTDSSDILHTNSLNSKFDCNQTTFLRIGGFIGSRTCEQNLTASGIAQNVEQNDIGDFDNTLVEANISNNQKLYDLNITVNYTKDTTTVFKMDYANQRAVIDLNKSTNNTNTTNLKKVNLVVTYQGKRGKKGKQLTQFSYTSSNIGQMILNKREW